MFKCEKCQTNSKPGESPVRVVVKTRSKNYAERSQDRGGTGLEIAREMVVHEACADSVNVEDTTVTPQLTVSLSEVVEEQSEPQNEQR